MQILFKSFSGLGMCWLMRYVRVLFVPWALIVLWPMGLPVSEAHPTEVVFAVVALHMVTAARLLDANVTLGALSKTTIRRWWWFKWRHDRQHYWLAGYLHLSCGRICSWPSRCHPRIWSAISWLYHSRSERDIHSYNENWKQEKKMYGN